MRLVLALLILLLACSRPLPAVEMVAGTDGALTVRTDRWVASFRGGDLQSLGDQVTGARYARASANGFDFPRLRYQDGREIVCATGAWEVLEEEARFVGRRGETGFTLRLRVDPRNGDLVLSQTAAGPTFGARSVSWGLDEAFHGETQLIVPAFGGGVLDAGNPADRITFDYPHFWEFQLAIVQRGDAGFSIWSEDVSGLFKSLQYDRNGQAFRLAFETENPGPFFDKAEARSAVWRLNVHRGDWRVAARRYREWMERAFGLTRWAEDQNWARNVQAMVIGRGNPRREFLPALAEHVHPGKTLLYIPQWRQHGYDVRYPDYTPADWVRSFIEEAHGLGFPVMLHVNLPGISPEHELYRDFRFRQVRDAASLGLLGWRWPDQIPVTHGFINPGDSLYRQQYVERMKRLREQTACDALHLDVSAPAWNDGNGLVEGMAYPAGARELHRDLKHALPEVVLGGENISELTLLHERFFQVWKARAPITPHPVRTFLCEPFASPVGYLGVPNADASPTDYEDYLGYYESWGVLPTVSVSLSRPEDLKGTRVRATLDEIRRRQEVDLAPDFDGPLDSRTRFRWKGRDGASAVIESTTGDSARFRIGDEIVWERIAGVSSYETPLTVLGWPAFDGNRYFGFQPEKPYVALRVPRTEPVLRVDSLTPNACIAAWRSDSSATVLQLASARGRRLVDLMTEFSGARKGTRIGGSDGPLQKGAMFGFAGAAEGGGERVLASVCPWHPEGDNQDKAWGDVYAELDVAIPPHAKEPILEWEVALGEHAMRGDGSTIRVAVDGETVLEQWKRDRAWERLRIPLEASGNITLRLTMSPGPRDSVSYDQVLWRSLRIIEAPGDETARVGLFAGKPVLGMENGRMRVQPSPTLLLEATSGAAVVFFTAPPTLVKGPVELGKLPFTSGTAGGYAYHDGMSVYGGGHLEEGMHDGRPVRVLNGHPPGEGQTLFRQTIRVAEEFQDPELRVTARIREGALTEGVGFRILLNGNKAWEWFEDQPGERKVSLPLDGYQGRLLLVEWVTDSAGDNGYDWALWVDPRIVSGDAG